MRLGVFLALVAAGFALDCNVGSLVLENGIITGKDYSSQPCAGKCERSSIDVNGKIFISLSCQENEIALWRYEKEKKAECEETLGETCLCSTSHCSDIKAEENIVHFSNDDITTDPAICYAGYYGNNATDNTGTVILNAGATTQCLLNQPCAQIKGVVSGIYVEVYMCLSTLACNSIIGQTNGSHTITGDNAITVTCCSDKNCLRLTSNNTNIKPDPTPIKGPNNITCKAGAQLNYQPLGAIGSFQCSGSCSSVSIKSVVGGTRWNPTLALLDLFTCDPVSVCSAVNLNNGCGNILLTQNTSIIRGCCCDTNNCIDPTAAPPVYPIKTLKCWTGIYIRTPSNWSVGAELACNEKCGRFDVVVNNQSVSYMTCTPYSVCAGLGIGDGDQTYNPPLEEETSIYCCSSHDNCNINEYDAQYIQPTLTNVPTTNYPILCYGNIHLNGVPISSGSYGMCNGECAMVTFTTSVFNQTHNTTIYTCDPVTVCKNLNISNNCGQIANGVSACCCDSDSCFDPNRQNRGNMTCFTGIYISDGYFNGGETVCNGWCASLSTIVNQKNSTTYYCAPVRTCRQLALGMGGDNNCASIPGANLTGCCCSDKNNCNLPDFLQTNVTGLTARNEPPIVCYEAIHVNGVAQTTPGYRVCNGFCVSMSFGLNTSASGSAQQTTLYTCDSSYSCNALGLRNSCGSVDGTVYSCCCDTDACIDPTVNRSPANNLTCYVGVQSKYVSAGAEMLCNGKCANLTTTVYGTLFTSYHCLPNAMCRSLALDNSCNVVQLDRSITGCCCDNGPSCNAASSNLNTSIPISPPDAPIACYSGIHINGSTWSAGAGWQACQGDCMTISLNTSLNGGYTWATIYTCDPTTICTALNINNRCGDIERGIFGCCCSDSGCIDPTKNPPKFPRGRPINCYTGLLSGFNNLTAGAEQPCDGSCALLTSTVGGANFTIFTCAPKTICNQLGLYDSCDTIRADRAITGCCCDNFDNCNAHSFGYNVSVPFTPPAHEEPIVCFQGIRVNNQFVAAAGYQACFGDCALLSFNTTINNKAQFVDYFTCDPASVCHQLGVVNSCAQIEPGVTGCCCEQDVCLDPFSKRRPGPPLTCYVGVKSQQGLQVGVNVGAEVYCDGMCGYVHGLTGMRGSWNVTGYFCMPTNICKSLDIYNGPRQLPGDRFVTAECCNYRDNCNVRDPSINTTQPISPPEYPITCYSGVFVNGFAIATNGWTTCNGDCVLISLNSSYANGTSVTADLYTCDPTVVCKGLNMMNTCNNVEDGLMGCCCNSNGCLDPTKKPPKKPGQLMCYVGFESPSYNISAGAAVACSGKCASLRGNINGSMITAYACADTNICRTLNLDDACTGVPGDREVHACCCDNYNYCNIYIDPRNNPNLTIPAPNPNIEFPITCWNAINLNGNDLGQGSWGVCNGDCASIQINTTVSGQYHSLTLYTCDPSSVCTQLNTRNRCHHIEPGVYGCCCDTDGCINPMKGKSPIPLTCFVGVQSTYNSAFQQGVGSTIYCNGKCASLSGQVGNYSTTTFHCVDPGICKSLELDNACNSLPTDREVTGCCCDNNPVCNVAQANVSIKVPSPQPNPAPFIACYSGLWLNGRPLVPGNVIGCQGQCASIQINTTYLSQSHSATLYTCDPATVCQQLNTSNSCGLLEPGLKGCCCDTDACIDPNRNKSPDIALYCYVGVYNGALNNSIGDSVLCDGGRKCFSISTTYNKAFYKVYQCVQPNICTGVGAGMGCINPVKDTDVTLCCCDSGNNCNSRFDPVTKNPPVLNNTSNENPIACWNGLYLNGQAVTSSGYSSCSGDCAAIQLNTTLTGTLQTAVLYTCDPVTVCQQLGIANTCGSLDSIPFITGCCCGTDGCLTPGTIIPKNQQLNCFAGVVSNFSTNPYNIVAGASTVCNGRCASLQSTVAGFGVTIYQCIDTNTCRFLGIDGTCNTIQADRAITGCCCGTGDYCNIDGANIPQPWKQNFTEPVLACYSGLWVNNVNVTSNGYQACQGKCASVTLSTTLNNGTGLNATLYTCDPSRVCNQMNLTNSCASPNNEPGITACCCDTNACIDPTVNRYPGSGLTCFVGVYNQANGFSQGATAPCPGKCASLKTYFGNNINKKAKAYFCLNTGQVEALGVDNGCRKIQNDFEVTGCVCDSSNNCNVDPDENVMNITAPPFLGTPIACWTGVNLNGKDLGQSSWGGCQGMCASVTLNTTYNGTRHILSLYTCDPVAACQAMNLNNNCAKLDGIDYGVDGSITGCCCNTDGCINPRSNRKPGNNLMCYVGVYAQYQNYSIGADTPCPGKCASLQTSFNQTKVKSFHCISMDQANALQSLLPDRCGPVSGDVDVTACVCDDFNNCNVNNDDYITQLQTNYSGNPLACWSGLYVNGNSLGNAGWSSCQGNCAVIQLNTTVVANTLNTLTLYTCDPAAVCQSLGLNNVCNTLDQLPGLTGCCCNYDACADSSSIYPKGSPIIMSTSSPNTTPSSGTTSMSVFALVFTAVYTLLQPQ